MGGCEILGINKMVYLWLFLLIVFETESKKQLCPSLPSTPGVVISCTIPKQNDQKIPCTGPIQGVPKGTVAKYKCEGDLDFAESEVKCKCYGKWKGLQDFQNTTDNCGSIVQKPFSLGGPTELANLSQQEIEQLDGNITKSNRGNTTEFALDALAFINFYRNKHGASLLRLNDSLSNAAQRWTEYEMNNNEFQSEPWSEKKTYISNQYLLTIDRDNFDPVAAVRLAVGRWYTSGFDYDYEVPVPSSFSAMMWNSTTDLGVGVASKGGNVLVVCNFFPPGNTYITGGQSGMDSLALFKKNVFPPLNSTKGSKK